MIDIKALGQVIRQHREAKGMSVAQLAEKVGVTTRYIYQIEAGERMPRMGVALRIIAALEIDIKELDIRVNTGVESYE